MPTSGLHIYVHTYVHIQHTQSGWGEPPYPQRVLHESRPCIIPDVIGHCSAHFTEEGTEVSKSEVAFSTGPLR